MESFYGESSCCAVKKDGNGCANKAYYVGGLCGVHYPRNKEKIALPKNPDGKKIKEEKKKSHEESVELAAERNRDEGKSGKIIVSKMRMMKSVEDVDGFLKVFPNHRHGGRTDGLGVPELSPMVLGPVKHREPDFPPAQNIENYFQSSKVYPHEADEEGNPLPQFYETRRKMFESEIPERHKFPGLKEKPLYSVFFEREGKEHHYSYVASRQFYCRQYQKLAFKTEALQKLFDLVERGYNLQILGYDGFDLDSEVENLKEIIAEHYRDGSKPFGHEAVLFTLMTLNSEDYPWPKKMTDGDK
jgi:hypothetical protein